MNLSERILETHLGGLGAWPGPKLKAFSGPRLGLGIMLGAGVDVVGGIEHTKVDVGELKNLFLGHYHL
jgi:hypothetical protein